MKSSVVPLQGHILNQSDEVETSADKGTRGLEIGVAQPVKVPADGWRVIEHTKFQEENQQSTSALGLSLLASDRRLRYSC